LAIASSNSSGVYIAGETWSDTPDGICGTNTSPGDFPICDPGNNAYFQNDLQGDNDGFVAYYQEAEASGLLWSTYFGGYYSGASYQEHLYDIAVDPKTDKVYICGATPAIDVPTSTAGDVI
jgi:hypothetical protein